MHYKLVDKKPKTFVLVFETNDELAGILHAFASITPRTGHRK